MEDENKDPARPTRQVQPGANFEHRQPDGDNHSRLVCRDCGYIQYDNPKVVVGSVAHWGSRILLCRRAINPRKGFWTLPAGYMELSETTQDGARREAREEACAEIEIERLLAVYNIPRLSQVQLIYAARLLSEDVTAGTESLEVGLFEWPEIPWSDLAFPSARWALGHYGESLSRADYPVQSNPPGELGNY
jgi:ADP-ribose pyrophosphatase YjhB (NUDIX family)